MWVVIFRPQRRRQMRQDELLASLEVGDEIVTAGGLYGRIRELRDDDLTVEIAPGTIVRVARRAVAGVITQEQEEEAEDEEANGEAR
jgi:preprotein translocase subunit YajC